MQKFTKAVFATSFLFLLFCFSPAISVGQTNVSGGIYSNTTWTFANSPYIVVDTVVVFPGVTLTIQPGVTVKFANNKRLEIRQATIIAIGTITDSITFTSNSASPTVGIWGDVYLNEYNVIGLTSSFNFCNFRYAQYGIYSYVQSCSEDSVGVKNSIFNLNQYGIYNYALGCCIDSCNFIDNNTGISSCGSIVTNCNISNNQTGLNSLSCCNYSLIQNCSVTTNQIGMDIHGSGIIIKNCTIDSNTNIGIRFAGGPNGELLTNCQIKNNGIGLITGQMLCQTNDIESNNIGIQVGSIYSQINCNKICNNVTYNLDYTLTFGSNISIPNNYWCTTDSTIIRSHIYDGYTNVSLGLVHFRPVDSIGCYLTGCNLGITATVTNATCDTCHNGHATAAIANGHPPYNYTWYTSPIQYTQTATGLSSGTYQLCVVDGNGCTACNSNIFVDSTNCNGFHVTANGTNETCFTCSDGSATVNVTGGTAPFAYTWYTSPMQNTQTATALSHGHYAVCVTDLYGCSACDSVTIGTGNCSAHFNLYPDTIPHTYTAVNMASGVPPIRYDWNWGDGSTHDTVAYPTHVYASAGYYSICLSITDSAGCTNTFCNNFYLHRPDNNTMVTINVIAPLTTGIKEATNQPISIFPNPASDLLTIIFSKISSPSQFKIFNMLGEMKYSSLISSQRTSIDISGLANGVYLVEVITENNILRQKFIKQQLRQ